MGAIPMASAMPGPGDTAGLWSRNQKRDHRRSGPFGPFRGVSGDYVRVLPYPAEIRRRGIEDESPV